MDSKYAVYLIFVLSAFVGMVLIFIAVKCLLFSSKDQEPQCILPDSLAQEIDSYETIIKSILEVAVNGSFKGSTMKELGTFINKFGSRISGSKTLEDSIDYVLNKSKSRNLDNVHGEPAMVPRWVRGKESATLLKPMIKNLAMLGLGSSIGTPTEGVIANAIVVDSFSDLKRRASDISGCIVVYNQKFVSYNQSREYREHGASEASKLGAVAVLIRSATPHISNTPHTGLTINHQNVRKIPAACISVEDADFLKRRAIEGKDLIIKIKMEAQTFPDVKSRNVIAEIQGSSKPDKVVVVSGYIDSWDVGQGVVDDAGGAFVTWNSLVLLKHLGLKPKRTIRSIMWTGEEFGKIGSSQYVQNHKSEEKNLQFVMESNRGVFTPLGLKVTGKDFVECTLQRIMRLLTPLGNMDIRNPDQGSSIKQWIEAGVPSATLTNKNDSYFLYHHTEFDTIKAEDPTDLDKGTAIFAAVSYVIADISIDLPHQS